MGIRGYEGGMSSKSIDELKKVISRNSQSEIDDLLVDITNCIDREGEDEDQLKSFFDIYEVCDFGTI